MNILDEGVEKWKGVCPKCGTEFVTTSSGVNGKYSSCPRLLCGVDSVPIYYIGNKKIEIEKTKSDLNLYWIIPLMVFMSIIVCLLFILS